MKRRIRAGIIFLTVLSALIAGCARETIGPGYGEDWKEQVTTEISAGISGLLDTGATATDSEADRLPTAEGELEVHFIDVGQGDATLIRCGENSMLIDAGENSEGELVTAYLQEQGVEQLDYVIGTHPHSDHIGGLDTVIRAFEPEVVMLPDKVHTSRTYEDVLLAVQEKELSITTPKPGETYVLGEAEFTIIAPVTDYASHLNNWSIRLRLVHGSNRFVFAGDAEEKAERDIVAGGLPLEAEVLQVGHHGSGTSTTDEFLQAVSPDYALISCGRDNQYGHPHADTLAKLKAAGSQIYRTDEMGTVVVTSDGTDLIWSCEPSETMAAGSTR